MPRLMDLLKTIGDAFENWRARKRQYRDPHYRVLEEYSRTPSSDNRDAVLAVESGANLGLYVVKSGLKLHGATRIAAFVHVEALSCEWLSERAIRFVGRYDAAICNHEGAIVAQGDGWVDIDVMA